MLPFLEGSIIHLGGGFVDIDNCQIQQLQNIFGQPIVVMGQGNRNELAFNWRLGVVRAFPLPASELTPQTQIHLLHFVLHNEMDLRDLMRWYQCEPVYYFLEFDHETEFYAIFSLRMQVKFYPKTQQAKVIGFVNQNHVLNCHCPECTLIRQEAKKIKPIKWRTKPSSIIQ